MKICAACSQELPKEKFSKKQWQIKKQRRCKECIAENRDVTLEASNNNDVSIGGASRCWTDEALFKQPPPREKCPICLLPLPKIISESKYQSCCGKLICNGCMYAVFTGGDNSLPDTTCCPFCRTPAVTLGREYIHIERLKERVEGGDFCAINELGCYYHDGEMGLLQDHDKSMELWLRAGELGYALAYFNIGFAYKHGHGIGWDAKKAKYYYELAAMRGGVLARHNLGNMEKRAGNMNRA